MNKIRTKKEPNVALDSKITYFCVPALFPVLSPFNTLSLFLPLPLEIILKILVMKRKDEEMDDDDGDEGNNLLNDFADVETTNQ